MTLGRQLRRPELPAAGARWCEAALPEGSVYRFLARERARLFPPELFADLFQPTGRRSVPPSILAVVMAMPLRPLTNGAFRSLFISVLRSR